MIRNAFKRSVAGALMVALALFFNAALTAAQSEEDIAQYLISYVAQSAEFADWLAQYPGWQGDAWTEDEGSTWEVEFWHEELDEWLGWAAVTVDVSGNVEIVESFVPRPLNNEDFQRGQAIISSFIKNDSEIATRLGDFNLWNMDISYDRWGQEWEVYFWRGIESLAVKLYLDLETEEVYISNIYDPNALEAQELAEQARNKAIMLAYEAPDYEQAMRGYDNWVTYVEEQGGGVYSVSFATGDRVLFFALVNIESGQILETASGQ